MLAFLGWLSGVPLGYLLARGLGWVTGRSIGLDITFLFPHTYIAIALLGTHVLAQRWHQHEQGFEYAPETAATDLPRFGERAGSQ